MDPAILAAMTLAILFHMIRWKVFSRMEVNKQYTSAIEFGRALKKVAADLFSGFHYLIKPIPNDRVIEKHVANIFEEELHVNVKTNADLIRSLSKIKGFRIIHLLVIAIALIGLAAGESFNYGHGLNEVWFAIPILMCILINLLIYSAAFILVDLYI